MRNVIVVVVVVLATALHASAWLLLHERVSPPNANGTLASVSFSPINQAKNGEVEGVKTPVGILPAKGELNIDGLEIDPSDLDTLLSIDTDRWKQEMGFRAAHLAQFKNLPEEIWKAHRRVADALGD